MALEADQIITSWGVPWDSSRKLFTCWLCGTLCCHRTGCIPHATSST